MSMVYWGVMIYGVTLDELDWKDDIDFQETAMKDELDITVKLPNGKSVLLSYEPTEDKSYFGLYAGYPWYERFQDITEKDADDAIVQFLLPYLDMTEENLRKHINDISTYNCG